MDPQLYHLRNTPSSPGSTQLPSLCECTEAVRVGVRVPVSHFCAQEPASVDVQAGLLRDCNQESLRDRGASVHTGAIFEVPSDRGLDRVPTNVPPTNAPAAHRVSSSGMCALCARSSTINLNSTQQVSSSQVTGWLAHNSVSAARLRTHTTLLAGTQPRSDVLRSQFVSRVFSRGPREI